MHNNQTELKPMKMITLFMPEKYLEMLDVLVSNNLYPNRSEALRMATWKFLDESVSLMRSVPAASTEDNKETMAEIDALLSKAGSSQKDEDDDDSPAAPRAKPSKSVHEI